MKLVKDAHNWRKMAGSTELIKRINSYLTCQFTISQDVPNDECLKEAEYILKLIEEYDSLKKGRFLLVHHLLGSWKAYPQKVNAKVTCMILTLFVFSQA